MQLRWGSALSQLHICRLFASLGQPDAMGTGAHVTQQQCRAGVQEGAIPSPLFALAK